MTALGEASDWFNYLPDGIELHDYSGKLIMPGFIDTHTHYPQTDMIASYGAQLLDWLEKYTFPTERQFSNRNIAEGVAEFFCDELLRNGTTTSAVFATIHPESVDAIFSAATDCGLVRASFTRSIIRSTMSKQAKALDNDSCDRAIRASFLHFVGDPDEQEDACEYIQDGLLILKQGRVTALGEASDWFNYLPDGIELHDYSGKLIMPGFIDTHTHYPQTDMIASYGAQLLDWLEKYTFPTEQLRQGYTRQFSAFCR